MKKIKLRKQKRNKLYFQNYTWIPTRYYGNRVVIRADYAHGTDNKGIEVKRYG